MELFTLPQKKEVQRPEKASSRKSVEDPLRKMQLEHARMSGMISRACGIFTIPGETFDAQLDGFREWLNIRGEELRNR